MEKVDGCCAKSPSFYIIFRKDPEVVVCIVDLVMDRIFPLEGDEVSLEWNWDDQDGVGEITDLRSKLQEHQMSMEEVTYRSPIAVVLVACIYP